jgi:predicted DNA-binding mobile mystery protein A
MASPVRSSPVNISDSLLFYSSGIDYSLLTNDNWIGYNLFVSKAESLKGLRRRIEREEIDRTFKQYPMLRVDLQPAKAGWLRTIRSALGMTASQLGRRLGVSQNAISEAERAESEGRITLNTLRKIADGLSCELIYALVPRVELDMIVHNRANQAAHRLVTDAAQGMALEDQATEYHTQVAEISAVRENLIGAGSSKIWD